MVYSRYKNNVFFLSGRLPLTFLIKKGVRNMDSHASMYFGLRMSEQKDVRMFPPVPMVYETMPEQAMNWEYHVLTVDMREGELPNTDDLNELGNAGWLLVSSVSMRTESSFNPIDELGNVGRRREGERQKVYYYFVRQKRA
jgi:hypothetical protein